MDVMKKERELLRKYFSNVCRELDQMLLDKATSERHLLPVLGHLEDISNRLFRSDENIRTSIRFSEIDDSTFKEEFNQVEFYREELIEYKFKCEVFLKKQEKRAYYKTWFTGPNEKLKDKDTSSMKHSKDYWSDPKLDEGEKCLGDCLLNNIYLDTENKDIPTVDEIVQDLSEDENELEKRKEIKHKNNIRFEEPDQEFIERYPRDIEESSRGEGNKGKLKKQEVTEGKAREKIEKMEDLRKSLDMKREEIEEEIEKLKEITVNQEIAFDDEDAVELQPENHDNWTDDTEGEENDAPHCEDDDFNKNTEYDSKATQKEIVDSTRWKKKRKKKSKEERSKIKWNKRLK